MERLRASIARLGLQRIRRQRKNAITACLALAVGFATAVSMFLVAFTQNKPTYCGLDREHTLQCYSNPQADVETKEEWKKGLPEFDGAEYRSQLLKKGGDKTRYPVVTLVLYFGGNRRWSGPTTLRAALTIPEGLGRWVQDYGVNLVELTWLPHDRVDEFQSDFRAVVEYLVQKRETGNYTPERRRLNHVGETLRLLSAVSGDSRFEDVAGSNDDGRGVSDMCEVLDRIEARGIEIGEVRGEARGKKLMVEGMLREKIPIDVIARVSSMGYDAIRSLAASIGASVVS